MSENQKHRVQHDSATPGPSRVVSRRSLRHDPATEDATIPMLYEPFRAAYMRPEPRRPRGLGPRLRGLAEDTHADLVRLRAAVWPLLERSRLALHNRAALGAAAGVAGLFAGMLLMHEPAPQASAAAPHLELAVEPAPIVAGICELTPEPVAPEPAQLARAVARRPAAAPVRRPVVRAQPAPRRKLAPPVITRPQATPSVNLARQRALAEEAARAEKAEVASAYFARASRKQGMASR